MKLSKYEKDALLEISNVCSYQASIALEEILGIPIEINISDKDIISLSDPVNHSTNNPEMYLSIYSAIEKSDLDGNILIVFPKESALILYDALINKRKGTTKRVDESVKKTLGEIGNIVSGRMLGVLNKFLKVKAIHTIPVVVPSFGDHIYDYVYFNLNEEAEKAMLIKVDTKLKFGKSEVSGQIIILLTNKSFKSLLDLIKNLEGGIEK